MASIKARVDKLEGRGKYGGASCKKHYQGYVQVPEVYRVKETHGATNTTC